MNSVNKKYINNNILYWEYLLNNHDIDKLEKFRLS